MGMSGGTSKWLRREHWITLADQVESWKQEHPSGHCIRQSQAKKSQHIHNAKQWAWYGHRNSLFGTCMIGTWILESILLLRRHFTLSKSMTRGWVPRWAIWLIFCNHSISQSQKNGFPPKKNCGKALAVKTQRKVWMGCFGLISSFQRKLWVKLNIYLTKSLNI